MNNQKQSNNNIVHLFSLKTSCIIIHNYLFYFQTTPSNMRLYEASIKRRATYLQRIARSFGITYTDGHTSWYRLTDSRIYREFMLQISFEKLVKMVKKTITFKF